MTTLPISGHAPGDLRDAFLSVFDQPGRYVRGKNITVDVDGEQVSLFDLCGRLWNCTDVLPGWACGFVEDSKRGYSYGSAARVIRSQLRKAA